MNGHAGFSHCSGFTTEQKPRLLKVDEINLLEKEVAQTLHEEELTPKQAEALYQLGLAIAKLQNVLYGN